MSNGLTCLTAGGDGNVCGDWRGLAAAFMLSNDLALLKVSVSFIESDLGFEALRTLSSVAERTGGPLSWIGDVDGDVDRSLLAVP